MSSHNILSQSESFLLPFGSPATLLKANLNPSSHPPPVATESNSKLFQLPLLRIGSILRRSRCSSRRRRCSGRKFKHVISSAATVIPSFSVIGSSQVLILLSSVDVCMYILDVSQFLELICSYFEYLQWYQKILLIWITGIIWLNVFIFISSLLMITRRTWLSYGHNKNSCAWVML